MLGLVVRQGLLPVTYVAVPALVVVVATVACSILARRATRLDPIAALRE